METTDDVINDFMGGTLRANQWRELRVVLEARLVDAKLQLVDTPVGSTSHRSLQRKVKEMTLQVNALLQEEAVAQFVEDSVIATVSRPHPLEVMDGFDD
ncbi:MAG: hypothetical protein RLZ42_249 [Armatimonadota bacterium]|jgi:hypothetical protein